MPTNDPSSNKNKNHQEIFTFWSLIILQSQAAQATQQQTRPPKPNKRKSLNYSKMRGARPPNNSDRPFPTNDFRIFWTIILKCAEWGTSGGSCDAKVKCIVDDLQLSSRDEENFFRIILRSALIVVELPAFAYWMPRLNLLLSSTRSHLHKK